MVALPSIFLATELLGSGRFAFKDPEWLLALAVLPLLASLRARRKVPVLVVTFESRV